MKYFFIVFVFLILSVREVTSQNNVGIGTNNPDTNAILDLSANDKGVLIPRMSSTQRNAISPSLGIAQKGMMVFDNDSTVFFFWNGYNWQTVGSGPMGPMGPAGPAASTILHTDFNDVTNIANTSDQVLKSWILPANTLVNDGSWIEIEVFGTISNQTAYPNLKVKVGGNFVIQYSPSNNGPFTGYFFVNTRMYRISSNYCKFFSWGLSRSSMPPLQAYNAAINLNTNVAIQFIAQDQIAGANVIQVNGFTIRKIE